MATNLSGVASIFALKFTKCPHMEATNLMKTIPHEKLIADVFYDIHGHDEKHIDFTVKCQTEIGKSESFQIEGKTTKYILRYECTLKVTIYFYIL